MLGTEDGLSLHSFNLRDVIGKHIVCEDGEKRYVEQISYSHRFADMVLINEVLEDEHHSKKWVHVLSLSCQMYGEPLPSMEQKQAFSRVFNCVRWEPTDGPEKGGSGLILPSGMTIRKN